MKTCTFVSILLNSMCIWHLCLKLYIVILIVGMYVTAKLNVGTVLFHIEDADRLCWTKDSISLLNSRFLLEDLLPKKVLEPNNGTYISTFIDYVHRTLDFIRNNTIGTTQEVMVLALADSVGGYLRSVLLPITKNQYYNGNLRYNETKRLYSLYEDIKYLLKTTGQGWAKAAPEHRKVEALPSLKVSIPKKNDSVNACSDFITQEGYSKGPTLSIPLPYLDDNQTPHSIALPIKPVSLHSLYAPSSAYLLQKYYVGSVKCLMSSTGCQRDVIQFNDKFDTWLQHYVVPHLNDEYWYPAFGGINRVIQTVKRVRLTSRNYHQKEMRSARSYNIPDIMYPPEEILSVPVRLRECKTNTTFRPYKLTAASCKNQQCKGAVEKRASVWPGSARGRVRQQPGINTGRQMPRIGGMAMMSHRTGAFGEPSGGVGGGDAHAQAGVGGPWGPGGTCGPGGPVTSGGVGGAGQPVPGGKYVFPLPGGQYTVPGSVYTIPGGQQPLPGQNILNSGEHIMPGCETIPGGVMPGNENLPGGENEVSGSEQEMPLDQDTSVDNQDMPPDDQDVSEGGETYDSEQPEESEQAQDSEQPQETEQDESEQPEQSEESEQAEEPEDSERHEEPDESEQSQEPEQPEDHEKALRPKKPERPTMATIPSMRTMPNMRARPTSEMKEPLKSPDLLIGPPDSQLTGVTSAARTDEPKDDDEDEQPDLKFTASIFTAVVDAAAPLLLSALLLSPDLAMINLALTLIVWALIAFIFVLINHDYDQIFLKDEDTRGKLFIDYIGERKKRMQDRRYRIHLKSCPHRKRKRVYSDVMEGGPAFTRYFHTYYSFINRFTGKIDKSEQSSPGKKDLYPETELFHRKPSGRVISVTRSASVVPEYSIEMGEDTVSLPLESHSLSSQGSSHDLDTIEPRIEAAIIDDDDETDDGVSSSEKGITFGEPKYTS